MKKARKAAAAKRPAPRKPAAIQQKAATVTDARQIYAITLHDASGQLVVALKYDGGLEKGAGFTTPDRAAKLFWDGVARHAQASGLLGRMRRGVERAAGV